MTRILERSDTGPLAIAKDSIQGSHIHLCRCGLSASQPFCDGSHRVARQETPGTLVRYVRREGQWVAEPVEVRPVPPATGGTPAADAATPGYESP